jgi:hypothetical protein
MSKLNSVRKGDRAEYITQGIFSALGFSLQILRQEDYGIDFLCTLVERGKIISYPTKSFTVQLKTNNKNIVYPLSDPLKVKWLLENNLPFFICYFDESENRVDFYSTSLLNEFIINKPVGVTKLSFKQEVGPGKCILPLRTHEKQKIFVIQLGRPFLSISLDDLADQNIIEQRKAILDKVITRELENIVFRNLKLPFMRWLHDYETNEKNILFGWVHFADDKIIEAKQLLENVGHIIMSLCYAYKSEGNSQDYEKLKDLVLKLPFNNVYKSSLINMGFRNESGDPIISIEKGG